MSGGDSGIRGGLHPDDWRYLYPPFFHEPAEVGPQSPVAIVGRSRLPFTEEILDERLHVLPGDVLAYLT